MLVMAGFLISRLFYLQVVQAGYWNLLADDQHQLNESLLPTRGEILVHDTTATTGTYPLATNRTMHLLYAIPKQITNAAEVTQALLPLVTLDQQTLLTRLSRPNDLYEPLQHNLTDEQMEAIKNLKLAGLDFIDERVRYYPEKNVGSQVLGFVGYDGDKKVG
jgi:cell division protein FtsI/penicillin-binding protein 2